jgi:hypothetical protein
MDMTSPQLVPKNCLKIAPVYPKRAEISSFSNIKVLDRSIGLNMVATKEKLSRGYSSKTIKDIKNNPSYITAKNNQANTAYPKPLILFSLDRAILKATAVKIKVKNAPVINNNEKSQMALLSNKPYKAKGIPRPKTRLIVSEPATPKYCPKNMDDLFIGCAKRSSVNSLEL